MRPLPTRQVALTIPKRLRVHTRFDRKLLGKLCAAAWTCIQAEVRRQLGRDDIVPGMIAAIQTHDELLAEFTQHIPPKGSHLIRYYGWYSNKARGMRRKAAEAAEQAGAAATNNSPILVGEGQGVRAARCAKPGRCSSSGCTKSTRYGCPKCQGQMKVVAFLEPPQGAVIEKILRHCGLWNPSTPRAPPPEDGWVYELDADSDSQPISSEQFGERNYVEIDEFLATF